MEVVGIGLSPTNEELAEIAHRAMSGSIYRIESALGMLAKLSGDMRLSRLHLSRALSSATLISDTGAEMRAMHQLGLLALASGNWNRTLNYSSLQTDKPKQYLQIVLQILFWLVLLDILMGMKSYPNHI